MAEGKALKEIARATDKLATLAEIQTQRMEKLEDLQREQCKILDRHDATVTTQLAGIATDIRSKVTSNIPGISGTTDSKGLVLLIFALTAAFLLAQAGQEGLKLLLGFLGPAP